MTSRNRLNSIANRAKAKRVTSKKPCGDCGYRFCKCEQDEPVSTECVTVEDVTAIIDEWTQQLGILDEAQVKAITEVCIANLPEILSESHIKLLIQNCVDAGAVTTEQIKEIVEGCIRTDAEICALIIEKIYENPASFLTSSTVKPIIEQCIATIEFPDGVSDAHIKLIAFQTILEQEQWIKQLIQECTPDPVEINIKAEVLQCLIDQNLTESGIKLIFEQCIEGRIPTEDEIKAIFVACLEEWEIAPECIKNFVTKCVLEILPEQVTKADVKCFIDECYGDQLHNEADILAIVNTALLSAPKPRTNEEIKAIIDDCVTDDRLKVIVLECINSLDGDLWTQSQLISLIESNSINAQQVKDLAQSCVDQAGILSVQAVEAIAKSVALICINNNPTTIPPILDEADVKSIFVDCLKDLVPTAINADGNTKAIDVDISCDSNGVITVDVVNDDGSVASGTGDLSKFFDSITPDPVSICFSYDSGTSFEADSSGKIQLDYDLKVLNWNTDTFKHVDFNSDLNCLEIPYCGPTEANINSLIMDALAEWTAGNGTDGITATQAKQIAETCIAAIPDPDTHCLTGANVSVNGTLVTVTLNQENCTPTQFSFNVGEGGGSEGCCNTDLVQSLIGTSLVTSVVQDNGITVGNTLDLSPLVPDTCCNESLSITSDGDTHTITLSQSNGPDVSAPLVVEQIPYCITGLQQEQAGQVVTVTVNQENCDDQSFSFTAGDTGGGSVECCNTNNTLTATVNTDAKTVDFVSTIDQSVGAAVTSSTSIPIETLAQAMFDIQVLTDVDGCSQYQQMTLCGQTFGSPIPLWQPTEPCCLRVCVKSPYTGEQVIGPIAVDTVITIDGTDTTLPAGQTFQTTLTDFSGPIDICVADVCDNDAFSAIESINVVPTHGCC